MQGPPLLLRGVVGIQVTGKMGAGLDASLEERQLEEEMQRQF